MQVQRQVPDNLVYWPVSGNNKILVRMPNHSPHSEHQENAWETHLQAIAVERSKHAYKALYLHFAPKIKSFYLQQGMRTNAEELTHEVFLKIWQKAHSYQPSKAKVSTWIFTIVRNLRIDYLRKKQITELSDESAPEAQDETNYSDELHTQRNEARLLEAFSTLDDEQKNVLQKVYFEDKSHQIAARELEMTPGVVKSRIRSALKILRSHMGGSQL